MVNKESIDKYTYRVEWSDVDNTHLAKCLEFPSLTAHGPTSAEEGISINKFILSRIAGAV